MRTLGVDMYRCAVDSDEITGGAQVGNSVYNVLKTVPGNGA